MLELVIDDEGNPLDDPERAALKGRLSTSSRQAANETPLPLSSSSQSYAPVGDDEAG